MELFRKPLLSWREPAEVARARRARCRRLLWGAGICAIASLLVSGGMFHAATHTADGEAAYAFFIVSVGLVVQAIVFGGFWFKHEGSRRIILRAATGRKVARNRVTAAAIVRHPLCPSYRALLTIRHDGTKTFEGIPHETSDGAIRQVWPESGRGVVPLQRSDEAIPGSDEAALSGAVYFEWPRLPAYWPTRRNVMRKVRLVALLLLLVPLVALLLSILAFGETRHDPDDDIGTGLPPAVFYTGVAFFIAVAVNAYFIAPLAIGCAVIGAIFGWNHGVIRVSEKGLTFGRIFRAGFSLEWSRVKAVVIRPIANEAGRQEVAVAYDYYGVDALFGRYLPARFEYERFAKALSAMTDVPPEATDGAGGIEIVVTGFAEKGRGSQEQESAAQETAP